MEITKHQIYFYTMIEIIEIGTKTEKDKNRHIREAKIQHLWKIKKLIDGTRNRRKAKKLTRLIILNYTERGKSNNYIITVTLYLHFILYYLLYIFLHVNLFLYISVISKKSSIQYLTYIIATFYISLQRKSNTLEYF